MRPKLESRLALRLPEETAAAWRAAAKASGLSMSDWVRKQVRVDGVEAVVTKKPTPRKVAKRPEVAAVDPALLRELARIGNNLNQVARALNRSPVFDRARLLVVLSGIESELRKVLARCTSSS